MSEWAVAYKDQGLGHGMYGVVVKDTNEVLFENLTKGKCEELVRRWNSQPDLLEACKELLENEPHGITPYFDKALRKMEAAIEKANKEG